MHIRIACLDACFWICMLKEGDLGAITSVSTTMLGTR